MLPQSIVPPTKNSLRNQFTDVSPSTSPCSFSGATLGNFLLNRLFRAEGPLLSRRPTLREGAALGRRGGQQRYAPPRAMRCHATCRAVLGYGWLCWAMPQCGVALLWRCTGCAMPCDGVLCSGLLCAATAPPQLCCATPCCGLLCHALPCFALLCCALLARAAPAMACICYAILCYAMQCYATPRPRLAIASGAACAAGEGWHAGLGRWGRRDRRRRLCWRG